jgi:NADPH:quinone reductase-like Zn-dependent oxidoreductase
MRGIPQTMRAAAIERFGGPEVLELRTLPVPEIDAGEVLIATHTAGVGSWDAEMRAGWWPEGRPRFPLVLGSGLRKGEAAMVHGASGGVGTLALQFAKLRGARVLATASGRDGVALARRLGADLAVDGKQEDIEAAARRFAPAGVDAVLATVGGKSLEQCIRALRRGGRLAYPNGVEPAPRKRAGVKIVVYDAEPGVREFQRLGKAVEAAKPRIVIAASYPLAQARRAHERIEKGHVLGKIVLRIRQGTATSNPR